ncbi:hypothetical protein J2S70_000113 [Trueperella bonasi]|uniref:Uncharacterized protein n=1 Tax=Trueperella bonasi TaxID=312286 RepID=A0ABT9NDS4_9ACTO|nr:hypothetical protein [Trueperella bonasi]
MNVDNHATYPEREPIPRNLLWIIALTVILFLIYLINPSLLTSDADSSSGKSSNRSSSSYAEVRPTAILPTESQNIPKRTQPSSSCISAMIEAENEMQAGGLSDEKLSATLDACEDRADWIAAVRIHPFAIGLHSANDQWAEDEIALICLSEQTRPACRISSE